MPETANVSLEEIDSLFTSSVGREDAAVKEQVTIRYTISFSSLFRRPLLYSFSFFLLSYFLQLFLIGELMLKIFIIIDRARYRIEGFDSRVIRGSMNSPRCLLGAWGPVCNFIFSFHLEIASSL